MLVVTKLDRLARSVADASSIARHLHTEGVTLNLGGEIYNPTGALMFHVLAVIAEFEANLISARTREGMAIAKKKGKLKGKQRRNVIKLYQQGESTQADIAALYNVSRRTIGRIITNTARKDMQ
jgi:DNA recombinase homolog pin